MTLTAAPNEGYGVLGWNVTDKDGKATSDYTLKMANDTATITLQKYLAEGFCPIQR